MSDWQFAGHNLEAADLTLHTLAVLTCLHLQYTDKPVMAVYVSSDHVFQLAKELLEGCELPTKVHPATTPMEEILASLQVRQ